VWPPDTLTSEATTRMLATAIATARSWPRRQRRGRRGSPEGRSATGADSCTGTRREATTTEWIPRCILRAAARLLIWRVLALGRPESWGRRRRPMTRWTSTDAFSNRFSCVGRSAAPWDRAGWFGGPPSGSRFRAGALSARPKSRLSAGYDIEVNRNTDVTGRATEPFDLFRIRPATFDSGRPVAEFVLPRRAGEALDRRPVGQHRVDVRGPRASRCHREHDPI